MTDNELELINMIRESKDPQQALIIALIIIGSALKQSLSYQEPFAGSQQVSV